MSDGNNNFIVTTTENVGGHRIRKYIGVESAEVVFKRKEADYSKESNFRDAKSEALEKIVNRASAKGGNAIIGTKFDYSMVGEISMEFGGGYINNYVTGLIVYGTVVEIKPVKQE